MSANIAFIAVHGGAGTHGLTHEKDVKKAMREACRRALSTIHSVDAPSLSMTEEAISSLEDNQYLNAGCGSNLTLAGTVECDASITSGRTGDFGAVGAVSGIKNPIRLASSVLAYSQVPDKLGRIPPLMLVSDGAREFARSFPEKVKCVSPLSLVTPQAEEQWNKWKRRLESSSDAALDLHAMQDTVGAIAWHARDGMSSGVSSGGLLLKYPGRVGEAAVFGAGCWAQQMSKDSTKYEIGCSISGAGEYIIRSVLARTIGDAFETAFTHGEEVDPHEILKSVLVNKFIEPCRRRGESDPTVGVLLLTTEQDDSGHTARLWCAFTTPSMAIAYASGENPHPKAMILRRPASNADVPSDIFITAISL